MVRYEQERTRRPRNSITRDEIVRAALQLCEARGVEALTIRAVAAEMGASPMSLYNHVDTKEHLLDAVLDEVMGRMNLVSDAGNSWREELVSFTLTLASHLAAHPWAVFALMARPDPGAATTAIGEVAIAAALRGGLSAEHAVTMFTAILSLVYGRAAFLAAALTPGAQPAVEIEARITAAQAQQYPATASVARELVGYTSVEHLERAVRALIDGLVGPA